MAIHRFIYTQNKISVENQLVFVNFVSNNVLTMIISEYILEKQIFQPNDANTLRKKGFAFIEINILWFYILCS